MKVSSELGRALAPKDSRQATRMEILMMSDVGQIEQSEGEDVDGYEEDGEDFLGDEANDDDDVQEHFNHVENANVDDKRRRAEALCMSSKTKRVRCD
ncbi:hypothetical protein E4U14_006195, partial [Claviceps sp. LM454 group G7]